MNQSGGLAPTRFSDRASEPEAHRLDSCWETSGFFSPSIPVSPTEKVHRSNTYLLLLSPHLCKSVVKQDFCECRALTLWFISLVLSL